MFPPSTKDQRTIRELCLIEIVNLVDNCDFFDDMTKLERQIVGLLESAGLVKIVETEYGLVIERIEQ